MKRKNAISVLLIFLMTVTVLSSCDISDLETSTDNEPIGKSILADSTTTVHKTATVTTAMPTATTTEKAIETTKAPIETKTPATTAKAATAAKKAPATTKKAAVTTKKAPVATKKAPVTAKNQYGYIYTHGGEDCSSPPFRI